MIHPAGINTMEKQSSLLYISYKKKTIYEEEETEQNERRKKSESVIFTQVWREPYTNEKYFFSLIVFKEKMSTKNDKSKEKSTQREVTHVSDWTSSKGIFLQFTLFYRTSWINKQVLLLP